MSNQRLAERGAMTTNQLMLSLFGRSFGATMKDEERFVQEVPETFQPLVGYLRSASAILELKSGAEHDTIFDAYRIDVAFFQGRLDDLQRLVKGAVRASIKRTNNGSYSVDEDVKKQWSFVQEHIPPLADAPLIDLPAERAALPADQLLAELKQEVDTGIDSMMKRFCLWLDLLVAKEYVGIVHFTGSTVGHYYYFRPYATEKVEMTNRNETTVDLTVPFGEQTTYSTVEGRRVKITEAVERHDHHIVRAKVDGLSDYTGRIPSRIVEFLGTVPEWIRSELRVVSGDITKEVVRRRVVRESEQYTERVTSTYKGSPAVALGAYALNGWSSDDLRSEETGFFRGQKVYTGEAKKEGNRALRICGMIVLAIGLAVGGIWYWMHSWNVSAAAAYQTYVTETTTGKEVFTITKSKSVTLPHGETLYYLGQNTNNSQMAFATDITTSWKMFPNQEGTQRGNYFTFFASESAPGTYYGTIELGATMGIAARMNVLYEDKDQVRFTIDYYIK